jgi:phosphoribosylglycinamide formyltransferase-1
VAIEKSAAQTEWTIQPPPIPTAALVSGSGTNLQAVIDAVREGLLPLDLKLVISNNPAAFALERARTARIPTIVMEFNRHLEDRVAYAVRLASVVRASGARLVLLLGWMHVLAHEFLEAGFEGVLNLHPGYLPEDPAADTVVFPDGTSLPVFRGAHALRDALAAKVALTGASLIEITRHVDRGPLLARKPLPLFPHGHEDEASALERLHNVEREVVREGLLTWIAQRCRS